MTDTQKVIAAAAATVLLWGSAFPGITAGLEAYGPGQLALLRFLFASAAMGGVALAKATGRRGAFRLPRRRDVPGLFALGALGFTLYHNGLNYGQQTVTSGSASFLTESAPIFATVLAVLFLGERLSMLGWAGLAVCLGGAGLIAFGEASGASLVDPGALLIMVAALAGAGYFVLQKDFMRRYRPMELTAYAMWTGTLLMGLWAPGLPEQVAAAPLEATLAVAYIGVFPGALGYVTYAYVLSKLSVARATSLLYLIPLAVIPIAWVWHGEVPTLTALSGGALILVGVALVQRAGRTEDDAPEEQTAAPVASDEPAPTPEAEAVQPDATRREKAVAQ